MEATITILKTNLADEAFDWFSKADIPMEYYVMIEKWQIPVVIFEGEGIYGDYIEMHWYNSAGNLHSVHDMPSKICFNYCNFLVVEWHKNGEPYRKNFKFNKLQIEYEMVFSSESMRFLPSKKKETEFHWLNKRGELHSFNDMPSLIKSDGVYWSNKGKHTRMSYSLNTELPCIIYKNGDIVFCKNENDSNETIKFPFSNKYYGDAIRLRLGRYEKYVKWPIRNFFI